MAHKRMESDDMEHRECHRITDTRADQDLDRLLTVRDVCRELGLTRSYVSTLSKRLGVGRKVGRDRMYLPEDVEALRHREDRRRTTS